MRFGLTGQFGSVIPVKRKDNTANTSQTNTVITSARRHQTDQQKNNNNNNMDSKPSGSSGPTPKKEKGEVKDHTLAILEPKKSPNRLIVDDNSAPDSSVIVLNPTKMEELKFFRGDTVQIKGKKRHETVCLILADPACPDNKIRMNKVVRSNLKGNSHILFIHIRLFSPFSFIQFHQQKCVWGMW